MRIVFSGLDGVMHPWRASRVGFGDVPVRLFEWLDVLEALLAPHEDVFVVLHSHWRHEMTDGELAAALRCIGDRFLGSVPKGPRYSGILQWLAKNPSVSSFRILDDQASEFPQPPPAELVLCHPEAGIYDWKVRRQLQEWLHELSTTVS